MKLKATACFIVALAAAACTQLKETPVVDFAMKDFKVESTPNCKVDSACAVFNIQYPEFVGIDSSVSRSIQSQLVVLLVDSTSAMETFGDMGENFIADYRQFQKDMPGYDLGWYYRGWVKVLISSDTLISVQADTEVFTGGAHSVYSTYFLNVKPATGAAYLLDAMLRPGYEDELNLLGAEELRNQIEDEVDSLGVPSFTLEGFELNNNYGFRKEGIVFIFNTYETGSYSDGPLEILIPYERLQGWIK